MLKQFTLLTSKNKNVKKMEKKSEWPTANPGGYSGQHKKIKPSKGTLQRSFK
jgi:hypothetical protein